MYTVGSIKTIFKAMGVLDKISASLEIIDITTDIMYALDLIINRASIFETLGWVSLIAAVFGTVLFVTKLLLIRKLYALFPKLREERNKIYQIKSLTEKHKKQLQTIGQSIRYF